MMIVEFYKVVIRKDLMNQNSSLQGEREADSHVEWRQGVWWRRLLQGTTNVLYLAVCSNEHLDRMFPLPQRHCQMSNITLDK